MTGERLDAWLEALAAPRPSPGGGAAGAVAAAMAAALVRMGSGIALARGAEGERRAELERVRDGAAMLHERLLALAAEDALAVARRGDLVAPQRELAACASAVAHLARRVAALGHPPARADAVMAAQLAAASATGAAHNVATAPGAPADDVTGATTDAEAARGDAAALAGGAD